VSEESSVNSAIRILDLSVTRFKTETPLTRIGGIVKKFFFSKSMSHVFHELTTIRFVLFLKFLNTNTVLHSVVILTIVGAVVLYVQ